uniref:IS431mec transposase n=1 Tax=Staphylococcus aureus subsp. aureus 120 TaxID=1221451 RepID=X5IXC5_STAAU|nr:IS431mec transposase [Staphylococcus aureus subsp. aureus 120]
MRKQRDNHSAYAFIKRLIKQFGKPQKVITDQAPSTKVAMVKVIKAFKLKPDCHCTSKYLNNLIEQDHRHIKVRKTRYQSINTAKNTLKGIEVHTEDSFLLKLYYKFRVIVIWDILYRAFSLKKLHIS